MYRRVVPAALLALVLVGAAACGNKSGEPDVAFTVPPASAKDKPCVEAKSVTTTVAPGSSLPGSSVPGSSVPGSEPTTTVAGAPSTTAASPTGSTPASGKPVVNVPVGPPPAELEKKDLREGTGAEVKAGDAIKAHYVGISCSTGKQFDSSWDKGGEPASFTLAEGGLIPGWVKGIPGMKVGGQRMLVIPAKDGYGAKGQPPDILPEETLVFVIDVTETGPPPTTTVPPSVPASAVPPTTPAAGAPTTTVAGQSGAPTTTAAAPTTTAAVPTTTAPPG